MAERNSLQLDTDLGDTDFDKYMSNKDVGSPVDLRIRGQITTKDDSSVTVAVNTVYKIEEWDNQSDESSDDESMPMDDGGDSMEQPEDEGEGDGGGENPILVILGPGKKHRPMSKGM